jgi:tartrate dehydratase beta subunit/fumarate hydratase class I family protein
MERGLVLLLMRTAAVLLALAIKRTVLVRFPLLVMLWVLVLAIQLLVLLVVMPGGVTTPPKTRQGELLTHLW